MDRNYSSANRHRMCLAAVLTVIIILSGCRMFSPRIPGNPEKQFHTDPALVTGTLDNDFRYVLMENHEPENRVSMHLVILAGSMEETDEQQGLAHFLEHMLFNGTEHFPPGELVKYFQSIGMQFGADANAHTGFQETVYDVVLPDGSKDSLRDGLVVMRDYAGTALLLEEEIEREKKVILAEKRDRDSSSYRMFVETLKFELPDMLLTKRLPIGTEETIKGATRETLKAYYDTWYRPDKMILVMVGDFKVPEAETLIKDSFQSLTPRAPAADHPEPGSIHHDGVKSFHFFDNEAGKTSVSIETLMSITPVKDSIDYRKEVLTETIANRILQNRLDELTRRPETPFTSASSSSGVFLRTIRYSDISAECSPEKWEVSLASIEQSLRQALEFGFTQPELDRVKQNYISGLEQGVKAASTRDSNMLSRMIISDVINEKIILSPQQSLSLYKPYIESLTLDQVNTSFRDIWNKDHRLVSVTGNAPLKDPELSSSQLVLSSYNTSVLVPVTRRIEEKSVVFPYLPEPEGAGEISRREDVADLGIHVVEFENGVRLNLKKTDFKANQIVFSLAFGAGKVSEPENNPGLASLSTQVINESGFGKLNSEELKRALAGKNTGMVFSVSEGSFLLTGGSIPDETQLMFQLIRTHLLDPAFREEAYELTLERMVQQYREMETTVDGVDAMSGKKFLAGNDSRFGYPEYHEYGKNTLEDVKNWVGRSMSEDALELSVVGDFDPDAIIRLAAQYLGTLPAGRKPWANIQKREERPGPVFPSGKELSLEIETVIPKGLVKVAYPTDDFWDISRTRRLSLLGAVFRERLRNSVREELGAAYSPFAYNYSSLAYPGYGIFQAVITVDPQLAGMVSDTVKGISENLIRDGVEGDELKRALDPILTSIRDMRRTNSYWLNSVLSNSGRYPQKYSWARTFESDYQSISVDDINRYAKQYLDNKKAATVIIVPEK